MPILLANSPIIPVGDSITAQAIVTAGTNKGLSNIGYLSAALALCGGLPILPHNGMLAVAGNTLSQVLSSLGTGGATLNALAPEAVVGMFGTNNLNDTFTDGQLTALYDQIFALLLTSPAKRIFIVPILPRFGGNVLTATGEHQRQLLNEYARQWCIANYPKCVFIDLDSLRITSSELTDGLHPNDFGGSRIGSVVGEAIAQHVKAGSVFDASSLDLLTSNPTFTGGTTIATGWANSAAPGGATITLSKDGNGYQRVQLTGTYTGSSLKQQITQYTNTTSLGKSVPANAVIESLIEFELADVPIGLAGIWGQVGLSTSGFANLITAQGVQPDYVNAVYPSKKGVYQLRGLRAQAAAGTPFYVDNVINIALLNSAGSSAVNIDLRIRRFECRRVA